MRPPRLVRFLAFFLTVGISVSCVAQSWSYQGTSMCFDPGSGIPQCSTTAAIQQMAGNRRQFNAQVEADRSALGEGIGLMVGALLRSWVEHRARVEAERKDLRYQLQTYQDASLDLLREIERQERSLQQSYHLLIQLDGKNSAEYEAMIMHSRDVAATYSWIREESDKNFRVIVAAKNLKYLRENVETEKRMYNTAYDAATNGYVFEQLMWGLVGFYRRGERAESEPAIRTAASQGDADLPSVTQNVFVWFDEPAPVSGDPLFEVVVTARAYDGALAILREARRGNTSVQAGTSVLDADYHPATVSLAAWQENNPGPAPALFYWQGEELSGTTPVMHFQMTRRAYEQMLALVAGTDLRVRPSGVTNRKP